MKVFNIGSREMTVKELREEFDQKLEVATGRYKVSSTKHIEDAAKQILPRETSRNVRGNVKQQLRHKIEDVKYDLNRERAAGFERDKDLHRIRGERGDLREQVEELRKTLVEQNKALKRTLSERESKKSS